MTTTETIAPKIRELVVQLSRRNTDPAHVLARDVQAHLNIILSSDSQVDNPHKQRARQALFAIEEVLTMIDQSDFRGAWQAARDAGNEWRVRPQ
jgi:hypothetical protein